MPLFFGKRLLSMTSSQKQPWFRGSRVVLGAADEPPVQDSRSHLAPPSRFPHGTSVQLRGSLCPGTQTTCTVLPQDEQQEEGLDAPHSSQEASTPQRPPGGGPLAGGRSRLQAPHRVPAGGLPLGSTGPAAEGTRPAHPRSEGAVDSVAAGSGAMGSGSTGSQKPLTQGLHHPPSS